VHRAQGLAPGNDAPGQTLPVVAEAPAPAPDASPGDLAGAPTQGEIRTEAEAQQRARLHAQHAEVAEAINLAQDVAPLVRQQQPEDLDPWLARPSARYVGGLAALCQGIV